MNTFSGGDAHLPLERSALPGHDVEAARAARIRERCHAALAQASREGRGIPGETDTGDRWSSHGVQEPRWRRVLEPALVAGVSLVFLADVIARALRLEGF